MEITLVSHTPLPGKAIAAAFLNMGIGVGFSNLEEVSDEQEADAIKEIFSSHLHAPLEYAHFNLLWNDIPLFLRAHLVRARIGWSYAERSLRFFDANLRNPMDNYDWDAMPTIRGKIGQRNGIFKGVNLQEIFEKEMERQMMFYDLLLQQGVAVEDARNIIGVWYPTAIQTSCSYLALRNLLSNRLSSQAHPFWQKAARQIKELVTKVSPILGNALVDSCEIAGRCVWNSRFDRDCDACIARGRKKAHVHIWNRTTTRGENTQCDCGIMRTFELEGK